MKINLVNAMSLQMFDWDAGKSHMVEMTPLTVYAAKTLVWGETIESFIGHEDLARIVAKQLDISVPVDRKSFKFKPGDIVLVAQVKGGRLPEGCTELPEGIKIQYIQLSMMC